MCQFTHFQEYLENFRKPEQIQNYNDDEFLITFTVGTFI